MRSVWSFMTLGYNGRGVAAAGPARRRDTSGPRPVDRAALLPARVPAATGAAVAGAFTPDHVVPAVGRHRRFEIIAVRQQVTIGRLVRGAGGQIGQPHIGAPGGPAVGGPLSGRLGPMGPDCAILVVMASVSRLRRMAFR